MAQNDLNEEECWKRAAWHQTEANSSKSGDAKKRISFHFSSQYSAIRRRNRRKSTKMEEKRSQSDEDNTVAANFLHSPQKIDKVLATLSNFGGDVEFLRLTHCSVFSCIGPTKKLIFLQSSAENCCLVSVFCLTLFLCSDFCLFFFCCSSDQWVAAFFEEIDLTRIASAELPSCSGPNDRCF